MYCISQKYKRIFSIPQNQVFQIHIHSFHSFANSNSNSEKSIFSKFSKSYSEIDFLKNFELSNGISSIYQVQIMIFQVIYSISKIEFREIKFFQSYFKFLIIDFHKTSRFLYKSIFTFSEIFFHHDSRFSKWLSFPRILQIFQTFKANIMFSNMHFQKFIAHAWFFVHLGNRTRFRQVEQS